MNSMTTTNGCLTFDNYAPSGSSLFPALSGMTLSGSITNSGDVVSLRCGLLNVSAVYEGYSVEKGVITYVFDVKVLGLNLQFAISSTGSACALPTGPLTTGSPVCFLRGTRIATPDGEVAVEALGVGDLVSTVENGIVVSRPVTWIGNRSVSLTPETAGIDAYPVRILAGAIREGVPSRDLLVTSEHCVFLDGVLIPARMLVNGRSIRIAAEMLAYEYFHVELERHGILISDGLETESYLDTGNRGNFVSDGVVSLRGAPALQPAHKSWADAAAPLVTAREQVEPIWSRLDARAAMLGLAAPVRPALSDAPDLHLLTDTGVEIAPTLFDGDVYAFVLPAGIRSVRLRSLSMRPSDVVGPFLDDRRPLGVQVGRIGLSQGRRRTAIDAHLNQTLLSGWHAQDSSVCRWTNGNAELPIDLSDSNGEPAFLDIEVVQSGRYETPDTVVARRAA